MDLGLVIASATVAFTVAAIFMLALRPVALSIGLIDTPGGRKIHTGDVPVTGGIAMFIGMFVGVSILPIPGNILISMFIASSILLSGARATRSTGAKTP